MDMVRTELAADVWSRVTLNKERGGCPTGATKAVRRCERAGISRQERQYMLRQKVRTDRVEESALRVAGYGCQQQRRVIEDVSRFGGDALQGGGTFATDTGQADLATRSNRGDRACLRRMFPQAHPVPFEG